MSDAESLTGQLLTFFEDILERREPPRDIERAEHITEAFADALEGESGEVRISHAASITRPVFDTYRRAPKKWPQLLAMADLYLGPRSSASPPTDNMTVAESLLRHFLTELSTEELEVLFGSIDEWGVFVGLSRIILDISPPLDTAQIFSFILHFDLFSRGDLARAISLGEIKNQLLAAPQLGTQAMDVVDHWLYEVDDDVRRRLDPIVLDGLVEGALNAPDLGEEELHERMRWRDGVLEQLEHSEDEGELQLAIRLRCTTGPRGDIDAQLKGIVESALRRPHVLAEAALIAMTRISGAHPIEAIEAARELVERHPDRDVSPTRERLADLYARLYSFALDTLASDPSFTARYPPPPTSWLLVAARSSDAPARVFVGNFLYVFIKRSAEDPWHHDVAKSFVRDHIQINMAAMRQPRSDLRNYFPRAFEALSELARDHADVDDMTSWLLEFMLDEELSIRTSATKLFYDIARTGDVTYHIKLPAWPTQQLEALAYQLTSPLIHEESWIPLLLRLAAEHPDTLETITHILKEIALPNYGAESILEHWDELWPLPAKEERFYDARATLSRAMDAFEALLRRQRELPEFAMLSPTVSFYWEVQHKEHERIKREAREQSMVGIMGLTVVPLIRGGAWTHHGDDKEPRQFSKSSYAFRLPREAMFDPLEEKRHFIDVYQTVNMLIGQWEEE